MPKNQAHNRVKHKFNNYDVTFTLDNKWTVKLNDVVKFKGNFKECKHYCKTN